MNICSALVTSGDILSKQRLNGPSDYMQCFQQEDAPNINPSRFMCWDNRWHGYGALRNRKRKTEGINRKLREAKVELVKGRTVDVIPRKVARPFVT